MSIELLKPQTSRKYTGLSTDDKPNLGPNDTGAKFFESDTYDVYTWRVNKWIKTSSQGLLIITDYGFEQAKGNIPGETPGTIFGHIDDLDPANPSMIWDYGDTQAIEVPLTADTELFMSSTSASDTNVGVLIFGMTDDYVYKTKLHIHTEGQSQHSVGNWFRVFEVTNVSEDAAVGNFYFAEADTLTLGVPNTPIKVHALMHAGEGTTHKASHTVPANHTLYINRLFLGTRRAEDCVFSFFAKRPGMPAFIERSDFPVYQNNAFLTIDPPFPVVEKTDFYFLGTTVTNNTQPVANIGYILVDNTI